MGRVSGLQVLAALLLVTIFGWSSAEKDAKAADENKGVENRFLFDLIKAKIKAKEHHDPPMYYAPPPMMPAPPPPQPQILPVIVKEAPTVVVKEPAPVYVREQSVVVKESPPVVVREPQVVVKKPQPVKQHHHHCSSCNSPYDHRE